MPQRCRAINAAAIIGTGLLEYLVAFVLFVAAYGVFVWRKATKHRARIKKLIRRHLKTLVLKRARGFTRDDYGNLVDSGWSKEVAYFYDNVIPEAWRSDYSLSDVAGFIEHEIRRLPRTTVEEWTGHHLDIATGDDFEGFVKEQLEAGGWQVRHTGKSGDQGADLVAEKDGISIAIQCKLYTQPVGNKAVQEALAAQRYYATNAAAVISNAAFTKSATKLAQSANVLLLHTSDIAAIDSLADGGEPLMAEWGRRHGA